VDDDSRTGSLAPALERGHVREKVSVPASEAGAAAHADDPGGGRAAGLPVEPLGRYADVSLHREAKVTPGAVVYRLDDRLFLANARYFKARAHEAIRAAPAPVSWLVFDAEAVTHTDSTGLEALTTLVGDLRHQGITLVVARLRTEMQDQLQLAGATDAIGAGHFYPTVDAAVDAFIHAEAETS